MALDDDANLELNKCMCIFKDRLDQLCSHRSRAHRHVRDRLIPFRTRYKMVLVDDGTPGTQEPWRAPSEEVKVVGTAADRSHHPSSPDPATRARQAITLPRVVPEQG